MDNIVKFILNHWLWISISMSIIWGLQGCQFVVLLPNKRKWFNKSFAYFFTFNLSFVSSFAGWCCVYILGSRYLDKNVGLSNIDLVLLFLVLLGITGHLPNVIFGISNAFIRLAQMAFGKLVPPKPPEQK